MSKKLDEDLEMIDLSDSGSYARETIPKNNVDRTPGKKSKKENIPPEEEYEESLEDDDAPEETGEKSIKSGTILQIVMISAILIVVGIVATMLIRWQKGIDIIVTEDDLTEDYDIESEDFYSIFDPNEVEGYVDDGELNIVILGDQSIYYCSDETGIANLIAEKTGAKVTALSLPDTKIALTNPGFTLESSEDAFNLYYLTLSICGGKHGSYDLQDSAVNYIENSDIYRDYVQSLREIDFSKVDILILSYGLNDYLQASRNIGDEVYSEQPYGTMDSLSGSLDSSLQNLNDRFPAMQVIISSPSFCIVKDEEGNEIGADLYNPGNGSLGDYVAFAKGVAQSHQASFADNYFFSNFNAGNYEGLLDEEGMPNAAARELIADHIISFFYFNR